MTIYDRAVQLVRDGDAVGLGSGRAATAFVRALAASGRRVACVPTSEATADLARSLGLRVVGLDALPLALTVDGADEVDPAGDLIKGYGRALVREKVVAAASDRLVILVGKNKLVAALGQRGKVPVEVVPLAVPLLLRRVGGMALSATPDVRDGKLFLTDNGNAVVDLHVRSVPDPAALDAELRAIPGVVGTGLFVGMASLVLVGDEDNDFALVEERTPRGDA
ncbi:MAG: ribose-5-phosphate isomerase RpiA [Gemmataceae bacterium]